MASERVERHTKRVELWGGAASMYILRGMIDASDIRPVPDNQEVYMDSSSGQTVVVEIVEPVSPPQRQGHAAFCFHDLADVSGATVIQIHTQRLETESLPALENVEFAEMARGLHDVPPSGSHEKQAIHVLLLLVRLQGSNGDLMLTFTAPEKAISNFAADLHLPGPGMSQENKLACSFQDMYQSLCISDKSLFS